MNENKVCFATIVASGEKPVGAIHAAHVGEGIATEFNATGKDIIMLTGAIVKEALEINRREGGRIAADLLAAIVIHELGSTVNSPVVKTALKLAGNSASAQEADENAEL